MEQKTNIVLIGMPGVGKSTIGVILAKVLGYSFMDADLLIQEQEGKLLREIIEEKGTDGFIEVENRVNASIRADRAIIATGGSVVYGKEAMEHLKEIGRVVYLKVSYAILEKRLADIKGRGVVLKKGQTLETLFEERSKLYEQYADIEVSEEGLDVEQTVEKLEEERRTCYVGITRAQRKLYMTYASIRTIFGRTEAHEPSRFLYEFPEELKEELAFRRKREDSFIGFGGNYDGWGSIGGGGIGNQLQCGQQ